MAKTNAAFMSGVPELLLLRLLAREEMYGYQLVRAIKTISNDTFDLAEGVIYPALHSLELRKLVKAKEKFAEGRSRIYYSLTAKGAKRLTELTTEWQRVRDGISHILGGSHG
jgi:PadR family transcriptional regulator, regulatory protein PadR